MSEARRFAGGWARLAASVCLLASCKSTTLTARYSVVPVLLGPVGQLGPAGRAPPDEPAGTFDTEVVDVSTSSAGLDGSSRAEQQRSAPSQVDWDVLIATNGSLDRVIVLSSLKCSGFDLFAIAGTYSQSECHAAGDVVEPGVDPAAPAPALPAPVSARREARPASPVCVTGVAACDRVFERYHRCIGTSPVIEAATRRELQAQLDDACQTLRSLATDAEGRDDVLRGCATLEASLPAFADKARCAP